MVQLTTSAPQRGAKAIFRRIASFYAVSPAAPAITDAAHARRVMLHWRLRMFLGMFFGYLVLYFCRKNISNAIPELGKDLGYDNESLGIIGTALYVTYGIGKFANGVMADRSNIKRFMATSLIASGIINILFASTTSLWLLALLWGMNGWFQSMGFPPIARGMTIWYPPEGRATRWAFWTCSHQAGTAIIMLTMPWILAWGTWRECFWMPGVLCVAFGLLILFGLADTPESKGLTSVDPFRKEAGSAPALADGEFRRAFVRHVLRNRNVWVIGLIDMCVYIARFGTLDWSKKFLMEMKGYDAHTAGVWAGLMPAAGVVGVLLSGWISDVVFRSRYRVVNAVFLLVLAGCMYGLLSTGSGHPTLDLLFLLGTGFFVEGPQSILGGVGAIDAGGSARVASSAVGLVGILAYTGASLSGWGSGWLVDHHGWSGAFWFWIAAALTGFVLCFFWKERKPSHG